MHRGTWALGIATLLCGVGCGIDPDQVGSDYEPLPEAANAVAAAVFEGQLYVHGGHVGSAHDQSREHTLSRFIRLDLDTPDARWEALTDPGIPVQQGSLFVHDGALYRLGGMTSMNAADEPIEIWSLDDFARYDRDTDSWEALPAMPDTRASHSLTLVDGVIYVVGGWTLHGESGSGVYSETWMSLDLEQTPLQWEEHDMPFQLRDHCAGHRDGKVYVLGGMLSGAFPVEPWVYDPVEDDWSRGPVLPPGGGLFGGFGCGATSADGELYFSAAESMLYRLNDAGDDWEAVGPTEAPRIFHQLVPHNDEILLVGGGLGTDVTPLDSVESVTVR